MFWAVSHTSSAVGLVTGMLCTTGVELLVPTAPAGVVPFTQRGSCVIFSSSHGLGSCSDTS